MSLQQQIQREMNDYAKLEKYLEKRKKRILRFPENKCFKEISDPDNADAFLIFNIERLPDYILYPNTEGALECLREASNQYIFFPLRNTNRRDTKSTTRGSIISNLIPNKTSKMKEL